MLIAVALVAGTGFAQVPSDPYTLTTVSRLYDKTGKLVSESRFLTAVDRAGSMVTVDLDPSRGGARQILDAVNHRDILVEPNTRMVSTAAYDWRINVRSCEERFHAFRGATVSVDRSAGAIEGVPVERVVVDSAVTGRIEVFMAPSLGCEMLRTLDSRAGLLVETRAVEKLKVGDPDPQLFAIPADYRWIG